MIKLDKSYSDYTDETDGKYPAGKGVNASSSEKYDGTPWLADMMNDEHGARQAIYKAAYGSVDGLSGVPDNAEQSDTLNAIKKLIDDPDKAHADLRGTSAHGATVKASPGQLVTRDEYGRAQFAAPVDGEDATRKADLDALKQMLMDSIVPVGFVYTQWPMTKSPEELNLYGTWEDISSKYAGLYTRVAGGDATEFNKQIAVSSQSGTSLTFASGHGITKGCRLIDTVTGEQRDVIDVSDDTVTIDIAFSSNLTTVLIGQSESLPNITGKGLIVFGGKKSDYPQTGAFRVKRVQDRNYSNSDGETNGWIDVSFDASLSSSVYGKSNHVNPNSLSVRIWKRIS